MSWNIAVWFYNLPLGGTAGLPPVLRSTLGSSSGLKKARETQISAEQPEGGAGVLIRFLKSPRNPNLC
jgi:hypothetical protein